MSTVSSTLRLTDKFTQPIERSIAAIDRMIGAMDMMTANGSAPELGQAFDAARAEIHLASNALDDFRRTLDDTDNSQAPRNLTSGFGGLSRAVIVVNQGLQLMQQAWSGIERVMTRADSRISADARLALINDGLRTREQLESQVLAVANRSRASYEATAELVARIGRQDFFKGNNDQALLFAETLNKGLVVSGATSSEAQNALIQLSQGIASGVLRGEEFNSIMENASVLAEMMTTSLGVTKGELRAMAEEGRLTADVVVSSIMQQRDVIDKQFSSMPVTFGQAMAIMGNHWSNFLDRMTQADQPVQRVMASLQELLVWLDTADGQRFFDGLAWAAGLTVGALIWLAGAAADVYGFFATYWPTIEPVMFGVAVAIGVAGAALGIYKGIVMATAAQELIAATVKAINTKSTLASASATAAATAAQWGLNAALLANPMTWVVVGAMALIAALVAVTRVILRLWNTNIDFRVGVLGIWNSVLNFFDQVPVFFARVGFGIADAFSVAKVKVLGALESMVNGAVGYINALIAKLNRIPGVSLDAVATVTWSAETAAAEEAKRQARAGTLAAMQQRAAVAAATRAAQLAADETRWRAAAAAQQGTEAAASATAPWDRKLDIGNVGVVGVVDKVKQGIDLSRQTLAYMVDIAERSALREVAALQANVQEESLHLSASDAKLMRAAASRNTNVYYLDFSSEVTNDVEVHQGEDWNDIKRRLVAETQAQIETGLSGIDEVLR